MAGYPARLHQGFKALVWHDDRMAEGRVSRTLRLEIKKALHPGKGRKAPWYHLYSEKHCLPALVITLTGFPVREYFIPPCPSCATLASYRKGLPALASLSERFTHAIPHILRVLTNISLNTLYST